MTTRHMSSVSSGLCSHSSRPTNAKLTDAERHALVDKRAVKCDRWTKRTFIRICSFMYHKWIHSRCGARTVAPTVPVPPVTSRPSTAASRACDCE
jgi:hypothetical protein